MELVGNTKLKYDTKLKIVQLWSFIILSTVLKMSDIGHRLISHDKITQFIYCSSSN